MAARNLLAEPRSAGTEETWSTLVAKFPPEDHAAVSAAAAAAVLASATEVEYVNAPPWRPDDEYASEVLFAVISSRSPLSGPGNDGQRFAHSSTIHHSRRHRQRGVRKGYGSLLAENRRRAGCVPARVLAAILAVEPYCVGRKVPAGLRGHGMEEAHHCGGYATAATAVGGVKPRGEAVWGRHTRRSGACGIEG